MHSDHNGIKLKINSRNVSEILKNLMTHTKYAWVNGKREIRKYFEANLHENSPYKNSGGCLYPSTQEEIYSNN